MLSLNTDTDILFLGYSDSALSGRLNFCVNTVGQLAN